MLTFMALAGMPARRFDPGMYQYGGMWFYPLGAIFRTCQAARLIKSDLAYYLDHPDEFGRFYIIARLYSAAWGLAGVWTVYRLGRRLYGGWILPAAAGACFALMPVVINGAHEVKPHLAGAVLVLLSVLAAVKYVQTGVTPWCIVTGILCGLAFGMVLTAIVAFAVIPTMAFLRRESWRRRILITIAAGGVGLATYCITNPYAVIGILNPKSTLRTNLGNLRQAGALFGRANDRGAIANAALLISEGASPPLAVFGAAGVFLACLAAARRPRAQVPAKAPTSRATVAILLAAPATLAFIQFFATAAGKPGEFGRFAILPDTALLLAAVALARAATSYRPNLEPLAAGFLVLLTAIFGASYLLAFSEDVNRMTTSSSRMEAARQLAALPPRAKTLGMYAEPAPYSLPPVDLTRWQLLLLPSHDSTASPDVIVRAIDSQSEATSDNPKYHRLYISGARPWLPARISWADKPFEILIRRDLLNSR
jgi:hypothetical protein